MIFYADLRKRVMIICLHGCLMHYNTIRIINWCKIYNMTIYRSIYLSISISLSLSIYIYIVYVIDMIW